MSGNNNNNSGAKTQRKSPRPDAGIPVGPGFKEERSRLIRQAREVVYRTPEVRPEKVAQLREAIEQGAYEIDARKIAEILIREWFPRRFA